MDWDNPVEAGGEAGGNGDGFSLNELKRTATNAAAAVDLGGGETSKRVPLRGRGYFIPYAHASRELAEQHEQTNIGKGLPELPYEEYCYMCDSFTVKRNNPMREAVQGLLDLAVRMPLKRVCGLVALYHQCKIEPLTGIPWPYNSIRAHAREHTIDPASILAENIRGVQVHIDAHVETMEVEEEDAEGAEGTEGVEDNAIELASQSSRGSRRKKARKRGRESEDDDEERVSTTTPSAVRLRPARRKKRRIDLKEEQAFMQLVRLQKTLLESWERMRAER
jgi:hypothetical protein